MKQIDARLLLKHDTTENWLLIDTTFVPLAGEMIVYDDYEPDWERNSDGSYVIIDGHRVQKTAIDKNRRLVPLWIPGVKIGDGNCYLSDLPFISTESGGGSIEIDIATTFDTTSADYDPDAVTPAQLVKDYVDSQIGYIHNFDIVIDDNGTSAGPSLPATEDNMYKLVLVPDPDAAAGDYIEWILIRDSSVTPATYSWEKVGSTHTDISGYVSVEAYEGTKINDVTLGADHEWNISVPAHTVSTSYTPVGDVTLSGISSSTETITSTGNFTPEGTISTPSITLTSSTVTVVTGQGTFDAGTTPSLGAATTGTFATKVLQVVAGANETLEFSYVDVEPAQPQGATNVFDSAVTAQGTFDAGTLPSLSAASTDDINVVSGATSDQPVFTGTQSSVSVSGEVEVADVSGATATFTGTADTISVSVPTITPTVI